MDRFGVSSAKKTVFPKTEAEYAAAAEYAEKLHEEVLLGEEKINKDLEASEAKMEDEDDGRIIIMAKVVKKYKAKDGNASPLLKGDIVEIEEMIAEKKLWRINFQGVSFLVPKANLKLLTPDEIKKLPSNKRPPPIKNVGPSISFSVPSTPQKTSTPQKAASTLQAPPASSQLAASTVVPPPMQEETPEPKEEKPETTTLQPAVTTTPVPAASPAAVPSDEGKKVEDEGKHSKDELEETLARREKEHEEAEKRMDEKIAALENAVAERDAALKAAEEKLAQAKKVQEAQRRLVDQAKKLKSAYERELACRREIDGLVVRIRMTVSAKDEKGLNDLTAEDLAL